MAEDGQKEQGTTVVGMRTTCENILEKKDENIVGTNIYVCIYIYVLQKFL